MSNLALAAAALAIAVPANAQKFVKFAEHDGFRIARDPETGSCRMVKNFGTVMISVQKGYLAPDETFYFTTQSTAWSQGAIADLDVVYSTRTTQLGTTRFPADGMAFGADKAVRLMTGLSFDFARWKDGFVMTFKRGNSELARVDLTGAGPALAALQDCTSQ